MLKWISMSMFLLFCFPTGNCSATIFHFVPAGIWRRIGSRWVSRPSSPPTLLTRSYPLQTSKPQLRWHLVCTFPYPQVLSCFLLLLSLSLSCYCFVSLPCFVLFSSPVFPPSPSFTFLNMANIKVCSFNVKGFNKPEKRSQVLYSKHKQCFNIFLQ